MRDKLVRVLDGALGTFLEECMGMDVSGSLWSAKALCSDIEMIKVRDVQFQYIKAGCDILTSSMTYQASLVTFNKAGISEPEAKRLYQLALKQIFQSISLSKVKVTAAISLGSFGCSRPNCAEFTGNFGSTCTETDIMEFHGWRLSNIRDSMVFTGGDIGWCLLFETIPCIMELEAICRVIEESYPEFTTKAVPNNYNCIWISLYAKTLQKKDSILAVLGNERDTLQDAVTFLASVPFVKGIGVNCCDPRETCLLLETIKRFCREDQLILCYPNGKTREGQSRIEPDQFVEFARGWVCAGADIIGGCCYTTPDHIRELKNMLLLT